MLVVNKVREEVRRMKGECIIVKADFEKTYDLVNGYFLMYKMERSRLCAGKGCLESPTILIIVNLSPTEQFVPTKGYSQGDLLTPFLFVIVVEGLVVVVRKVEQKG